MGWSGGTYTRARDFTDDEANGIKMLSANFDEEHDEIETGINNCLAKDGQNSPSANLPMSAKRHINCGNAVERNEYAALGQVQDGVSKAATTGGAADEYELTLTPSLTAYADGQRFIFKAHASCTGTSTMDIDSLGTVTILMNNANLTENDILVNRVYMIVYYGSDFHLFSQVPTAETPDYVIVKEYFTANDTWTCPEGVTKVLVQCWGGGGGAGVLYGGQGGCYAESYRTVEPDAEYDIVIGAAGTGGSGPVPSIDGTAGGDTVFGSNTVVAKGGAGNGDAQSGGNIGDLTAVGGTGLLYTKNMDDDNEGYLGGWSMGGTTNYTMWRAGTAPGGGGSCRRAPSIGYYDGALGLITLTYVELVA